MLYYVKKLLQFDMVKKSDLLYHTCYTYGFAQLFFIFSFSISPNIREGLLEAFYGVYEKDPDKV